MICSIMRWVRWVVNFRISGRGKYIVAIGDNGLHGLSPLSSFKWPFQRLDDSQKTDQKEASDTLAPWQHATACFSYL